MAPVIIKLGSHDTLMPSDLDCENEEGKSILQCKEPIRQHYFDKFFRDCLNSKDNSPSKNQESEVDKLKLEISELKETIS